MAARLTGGVALPPSKTAAWSGSAHALASTMCPDRKVRFEFQHALNEPHDRDTGKCRDAGVIETGGPPPRRPRNEADFSMITLARPCHRGRSAILSLSRPSQLPAKRRSQRFPWRATRVCMNMRQPGGTDDDRLRAASDIRVVCGGSCGRATGGGFPHLFRRRDVTRPAGDDVNPRAQLVRARPAGLFTTQGRRDDGVTAGQPGTRRWGCT